LEYVFENGKFLIRPQNFVGKNSSEIERKENEPKVRKLEEEEKEQWNKRIVPQEKVIVHDKGRRDMPKSTT
jgi:hypothetical protein